jgi:fructose-1,6-bisphosphatase/inositol monophosphatase family enzyme
MTPHELLAVLRGCADRISQALEDCADWATPGARPTQHACDRVADAAAVDHLVESGCGVLSEERPPVQLDRDAVVIVDPLDGTRNALSGHPWFGPSLCGLLAGRPVAAVVLNLATGDRYEALGGHGVTLNGCPARPRCLDGAAQGPVVVTSGTGRAPTPLRPFYGALAFGLADVAVGRVDGFIDFDDHHHRSWDYAAGVFLCEAAGAPVTDGLGRSLDPLQPGARAPVAARDDELLEQLLAERNA